MPDYCSQALVTLKQSANFQVSASSTTSVSVTVRNTGYDADCSNFKLKFLTCTSVDF